MATAEIKYRCESCGNIHDDEDDARDCCPNRAIEVFCCPACGEDYDDEEEAIECCPDANTEASDPPSVSHFPDPSITDTQEYVRAYCELNKLTYEGANHVQQ